MLNIFGLTQDIRPATVAEADLRFAGDHRPLVSQLHEEISKGDQETDLVYTRRINKVIANRLAHINWNELPATKYNMRIPIWENYILAFMGRFSGIPEYSKYHFIDPLRSLERGIGICGDASMVMSQLLDRVQIENNIISMPGHVILSVKLDDKEMLFDPDFGVELGISLSDLKKIGQKAGVFYGRSYPQSEVDIMSLVYSNAHLAKKWDNVAEFVTKKYYFEPFAYFIKWFLPILLLGAATFIQIKYPKTK